MIDVQKTTWRCPEGHEGTCFIGWHDGKNVPVCHHCRQPTERVTITVKGWSVPPLGDGAVLECVDDRQGCRQCHGTGIRHAYDTGSAISSSCDCVEY